MHQFRGDKLQLDCRSNANTLLKFCLTYQKIFKFLWDVYVRFYKLLFWILTTTAWVWGPKQMGCALLISHTIAYKQGDGILNNEILTVITLQN